MDKTDKLRNIIGGIDNLLEVYKCVNDAPVAHVSCAYQGRRQEFNRTGAKHFYGIWREIMHPLSQKVRPFSMST